MRTRPTAHSWGRWTPYPAARWASPRRLPEGTHGTVGPGAFGPRAPGARRAGRADAAAARLARCAVGAYAPQRPPSPASLARTCALGSLGTLRGTPRAEVAAGGAGAGGSDGAMGGVGGAKPRFWGGRPPPATDLGPSLAFAASFAGRPGGGDGGRSGGGVGRRGPPAEPSWLRGRPTASGGTVPPGPGRWVRRLALLGPGAGPNPQSHAVGGPRSAGRSVPPQTLGAWDAGGMALARPGGLGPPGRAGEPLVHPSGGGPSPSRRDAWKGCTQGGHPPAGAWCGRQGTPRPGARPVPRALSLGEGRGPGARVWGVEGVPRGG